MYAFQDILLNLLRFNIIKSDARDESVNNYQRQLNFVIAKKIFIIKRTNNVFQIEKC